MSKKSTPSTPPPLAENTSDTPRNETQGVFNFIKEMGSALITALIVMAYVIQAFTIPTGSMERSLLINDFLLGLKFIYGAPVIPQTSSIPLLNTLPIPDTYWRFPAITNPKRGDVIIFKYPGFDRKDYIKRCVAVAGDTVEVKGTDLFVNGVLQVLPPKSQFVYDSAQIQQGLPALTAEQRQHFTALYIPKKGDTLRLNNLPAREFHFYKNLIRQENPYQKVTESIRIFANGNDISEEPLPYLYDQKSATWQTFPFSALPFGTLDTLNYWTQYQMYYDAILPAPALKDRKAEVRNTLFIDGQKVDSYVVKFDNYFMMGDNRDNSADSRYWGFLNRNFIKAQALIIYFSFDNLDKQFSFRNPLSWPSIPFRIRYERMGKLIRPWDGAPQNNDAP